MIEVAARDTLFSMRDIPTGLEIEGARSASERGRAGEMERPGGRAGVATPPPLLFFFFGRRQHRYRHRQVAIKSPSSRHHC